LTATPAPTPLKSYQAMSMRTIYRCLPLAIAIVFSMCAPPDKDAQTRSRDTTHTLTGREDQLHEDDWRHSPEINSNEYPIVDTSKIVRDSISLVDLDTIVHQNDSLISKYRKQ
jgi:hypothetical protein